MRGVCVGSPGWGGGAMLWAGAGTRRWKLSTSSQFGGDAWAAGPVQQGGNGAERAFTPSLRPEHFQEERR